MDIITTVIYLVLFIIMMVFVFSIGMLRQYMPKREILLVLVVAFLIGCIGGAFFLEPIYEELPQVASIVQKNMPNNEETIYLDLSSSIDTDQLREKLSSIEGFKSFEETSITIPMWDFSNFEREYFNERLCYVDSHYKNYNVSSDTLYIELEDNYTASEALKTFSDWYKLVYGDTLSYAQVHAKLVIASSSLDQFEQNLMDRGIVASHIEGPVQNRINDTNSSMIPSTQFVLITGGVGVIVSLIGIFFDSLVVYYRRFRKFVTEKKKR